MFKIFSTYILLNKYIKCNFRGQRCGTTTIVDIRRQKVSKPSFVASSWSNTSINSHSLKRKFLISLNDTEHPTVH